MAYTLDVFLEYLCSIQDLENLYAHRYIFCDVNRGDPFVALPSLDCRTIDQRPYRHCEQHFISELILILLCWDFVEYFKSDAR